MFPFKKKEVLPPPAEAPVVEGLPPKVCPFAPGKAVCSTCGREDAVCGLKGDGVRVGNLGRLWACSWCDFSQGVPDNYAYNFLPEDYIYPPSPRPAPCSRVEYLECRACKGKVAMPCEAFRREVSSGFVLCSCGAKVGWAAEGGGPSLSSFLGELNEDEVRRIIRDERNW